MTATTPAANDDAVAAIHRLVADAQAAQSDIEPFLALHAPEAIVVNFGGRRVLGRDALGEAMAQALATPLADVTTTAEVLDVRFVRPDVALVSCTKHVRDGRDPAVSRHDRGSLTYVVALDDGRWRIALAQTTPVAG
jgi:uncharacterized protein (TIGR02246 family)